MSKENLSKKSNQIKLIPTSPKQYETRSKPNNDETKVKPKSNQTKNKPIHKQTNKNKANNN